MVPIEMGHEKIEKKDQCTGGYRFLELIRNISIGLINKEFKKSVDKITAFL